MIKDDNQMFVEYNVDEGLQLDVRGFQLEFGLLGRRSPFSFLSPSSFPSLFLLASLFLIRTKVICLFDLSPFLVSGGDTVPYYPLRAGCLV